MKRRSLILTTGLALALLSATTAARAERLGGAYRGPEDAQATKDTSQTGTGDSSGTNPDSGPAAGSDDSGGGGVGEGGGDSGGGGGGDGGGDGGGGGDTGGPEGGGGGDTGGDTGFGGGGGGGDGRSGGGDAGGGGGGGTTGGSSGGVGGGKKSSGKQDQLLRVQWYFEHNREKYLYDVAAERNRNTPPPRKSAPAVLTYLPADTRIRSSVTTEDRERIFDALRKNALAHEDVVRDAAVLALGKVGTPDAVTILKNRFREESKTDIKEDVLLALGTARTPEAIDTLVETLKAGRPNFQSYALLGLGLTRDPVRAGPPVLEWFRQNVGRGRQMEDGLASAATALGALGFQEAENDLIAAAKNKATTNVVKAAVAHALGRLRGENGRKALEGMLDQSNDVAQAAILALGEYGDVGTARLLAGKEGVGRADSLGSGFACVSLAKVLSRVPEGEWKKLPDAIREVALKPAKNSLGAQYANLALAMLDGGIDAELRRYYTEELKETKGGADLGVAITMACGVGSVGGTDTLLTKLAKEAGGDPKLRCYSAMALGMVGDPSVTAETLRSVYGSTDNADVQRGAVLGLGLVGDRRDVGFLIDVIVKTDPARPFAGYTRGAAVMSLGMIRDGESVGLIANQLTNTDPYIRAYAIAALGYLADKDPSPALPKLYEHANFRSEYRSLFTAMRNL